jgi:predicted NBD/HSP70 family sugar kinase
VVALEPTSGAAVGLDFGFSRVRAAVVNAAHEVVARDECSPGRMYGPDAAVEAAAELVRRTVEASGTPPERIVGVGAGVPLLAMQVAALDASGAPFPGSHLSAGWEGVDIGARLRETLPYPVTIDNDTNCAARGELHWGAGQGLEDFVFIKLHSGVGGALVLDGAVRRGRTGGAGELGHMSLDFSGPLCRCGNRGCLEAYVGIPALLGSLQPWFTEPLTLHRMLDLLASHNPACTRAVLDAAHQIGRAAGALCNAVNPQAVILGGALSRAGTLLLHEARRALAQTCLAINADVSMELATLGADAGPQGAAALALAATTTP